MVVLVGTLVTAARLYLQVVVEQVFAVAPSNSLGVGEAAGCCGGSPPCIGVVCWSTIT